MMFVTIWSVVLFSAALTCCVLIYLFYCYLWDYWTIFIETGFWFWVTIICWYAGPTSDIILSKNGWTNNFHWSELVTNNPVGFEGTISSILKYFEGYGIISWWACVLISVQWLSKITKQYDFMISLNFNLEVV